MSSIKNFKFIKQEFLELEQIAFKGNWIYPFNEEATTKLPFYNYGKNKKILDTMIQEDKFKYYKIDKVQLLNSF